MQLHSATEGTVDANARQPGRWRTLNLAWVSFFLTFVVWYSLGAFSTTIARVLHLTRDQSQVLLLCNEPVVVITDAGIEKDLTAVKAEYRALMDRDLPAFNKQLTSGGAMAVSAGN